MNLTIEGQSVAMRSTLPSPLILGLFVLAVLPVSAFASEAKGVPGQIHGESAAQYRLPVRPIMTSHYDQFLQTHSNQRIEWQEPESRPIQIVRPKWRFTSPGAAMQGTVESTGNKIRFRLLL